MCEDKKTDSRSQQECQKELEELRERLKDLENEIKKKEEEVREYTSHLQRLQADFDNYKKQM
ncbi:MAG TPA: nucleotide exchange factor GrpE, partial [Methanothermobacter thermautotrophicus]|nr:nucleotide exchange factor GrpE [Methanothermobacter thermautotrophicus]